MEQYWFSSRLHWVLLHETQERLKSHPFNQQPLGQVPDAVPETQVIKNQEDHEGGEWKVE